MFVLTYRNNEGSLRVSPRSYATAVQAKGFALYYARYDFGRTLSILDVSPLLAYTERFIPSHSPEGVAYAEGCRCFECCGSLGCEGCHYGLEWGHKAHRDCKVATEELALAASEEAAYGDEGPVGCDSHDAISCSLCGTYM